MSDKHYLADLCQRFNAGAPMKFVFFWGHQIGKNGVSVTCFSQWYPAQFVIDGVLYPTAEHYMMAQKAELFNDTETLALILNAPTPAAAKALGRQVRGFDDARWLAQRFAVVVRANQAKFAQNPELDEVLKKTGSAIIVEASPVDRIWGIGLAKADAQANDPNQWRGLNLLGFALMQVRDQRL
jgi:ribA/ribD-fused uncharacterized protein